MNIIIAMAGLSSRFSEAGYNLPKYMLYAGEKSMFNIAVRSFEKYFQSANFTFIARNIFDTERFIIEELKLLGINNFQIIILTKPTKGQAESVKLGIEKSNIRNADPIIIFNIDTFRLNYSYPKNIERWDGYLEVFKGSGTNWSFARTESSKSTKVIETAEKNEISDNCSTGLYYFKKAQDFLNAYNSFKNTGNDQKELYVAPLYNYLIENGKEIHIEIIKFENVIFCGVPSEYLAFLKTSICN